MPRNPPLKSTNPPREAISFTRSKAVPKKPTPVTTSPKAIANTAHSLLSCLKPLKHKIIKPTLSVENKAENKMTSREESAVIVKTAESTIKPSAVNTQ